MGILFTFVLFLVSFWSCTCEESQVLVVNGDDANIQDFPYQIRLNGDGALCGGALISQTFIVTAAHCVALANVENVRTYAGSDQVDGGMERFARSVIIHPDYVSGDLRNDIALIEVDEYPFTDTIRNVVMADTADTFEGTPAIVTGWGGTSDGGPIPTQLQYGKVVVVSNSECQPVEDSQMCAASEEGASICPGDSGGPLVRESDKVLIGINSYIVNGCESGLPNGFTRVTSFRQWIRDNSGV